jgi:hypothetical protein
MIKQLKPFLFIGISSVKFSAKPELFSQFTKVAGFLVIFFALFNLLICENS